MKTAAVVMGLSLAANALLLGAALLRPTETRTFFRDVFRASEAQPRETRSAAVTSPQGSAANSTASAGAFMWSDLQPDDFQGLAARLRAAGFPPTIVRTIVMAQVNEHIMARRRELLPQPPAEYWKTGRQEQMSARNSAALRELNREHTRLLREALGPDFHRGSEVEMAAQERRQFGDLAPEKIQLMRKIAADYQELTAKVHEDSLGIMLPEDRAKLAFLEREQRADLERLLTPAELQEYDYRNHPASHQLRGRLGSFEPTRDEFHALFAAQKAFEEKFGSGIISRMETRGVDFARERAQATQQLEADFQRILGEGRYAEFKRANESGRQGGANEDHVGRLVARLNLPPATTATVLSVQQDILQRAAATRENRALSAEQRSAQLATLADEAAKRLTQALGDRGTEAYKQNGGQWLTALTQQPPAPRPVPR